MNEIQVYESLLSEDIRKFEDTLNRFSSSCKYMRTKGDELHAVWTGASKESFIRQYQADCTLLKELQDILTEMKEAMGYALSEYERCQRDMESVAKGIPI